MCCGLTSKTRLLSTDRCCNKVNFEGKGRKGKNWKMSKVECLRLIFYQERDLNVFRRPGVSVRKERLKSRKSEGENGTQETRWCANSGSCSFQIFFSIAARLNYHLVLLFHPKSRQESIAWVLCSAVPQSPSDVLISIVVRCMYH